MSTTRDILAALGVPGVLLMIGIIGASITTANQLVRPGVSFYDDLARCRRWCHRQCRSLTPSLAWPGVWPRVPVGPRSIRWPIDTVSLTSAVGLAVVQRLPVVLRWGVGLAWAIGVAIAMTIAAAMALVLFTFVSVPASIVAAVIDTSTVIRGGVPPDGVSTSRIRSQHHRQQSDTRARLEALRGAYPVDHVTVPPARL